MAGITQKSFETLFPLWSLKKTVVGYIDLEQKETYKKLSRFLFLGLSQKKCIWEQSSDNPRTKESYYRSDKKNISGRMCSVYWQFRDSYSCVFTTPLDSSRAYTGKTTLWNVSLKFCAKFVHKKKSLSTINILLFAVAWLLLLKFLWVAFFSVSPEINIFHFSWLHKKRYLKILRLKNMLSICLFF